MEKFKRFFILVIVILIYTGIYNRNLNATENKSINANGTIIIDFTDVNPDSGTMVYRIFDKNLAQIIDELNKSLSAENNIDICKVLGESAKDKADELKKNEIIDEKIISNEREAFLKKMYKRYKKAHSQRWISKKKDILEVYVFHSGKKGEIRIEEKKRKTRIAQDVSTLSKLIIFSLTKSDVLIAMDSRQYTLVKPNGAVTVSATIDKEKEEKMEIFTGPTEHWFLSADLLLLKLSQAKFDMDHGTIKPRETPKVFYLGINWMIGDILKEKQSILKNFFVKSMMKFSKKPFDSYGLGLGYRFPSVKVLGIDISSFSVFSAIVWTKETVVKDDISNTLTKRQIQFGLSFNLDKIKEWLK